MSRVLCVWVTALLAVLCVCAPVSGIDLRHTFSRSASMKLGGGPAGWGGGSKIKPVDVEIKDIQGADGDKAMVSKVFSDTYKTLNEIPSFKWKSKNGAEVSKTNEILAEPTVKTIRTVPVDYKGTLYHVNFALLDVKEKEKEKEKSWEESFTVIVPKGQTPKNAHVDLATSLLTYEHLASQIGSLKDNKGVSLDWTSEMYKEFTDKGLDAFKSEDAAASAPASKVPEDQCKQILTWANEGKLWLGNYHYTASYARNLYCHCTHLKSVQAIDMHKKRHKQLEALVQKPVQHLIDLYTMEVDAHLSTGCSCPALNFWEFRGAVSGTVASQGGKLALEAWGSTPPTCGADVEPFYRFFGTCQRALVTSKATCRSPVFF